MGKTPRKGKPSTSNKTDNSTQRSSTPNRSNTPGQQPGQQPGKRLRMSSGRTDAEADAEIAIDAVLGALSDPDTLERFVSSLCSIPNIKAKLVECLIPSLDKQVSDILEPLKATVDSLQAMLDAAETRNTDLANKHDDLEQYTRRQNIRISGIQENEGEKTDDLVTDFAKKALNIDLTDAKIDLSHRVGKRQTNKPCRDIIVRFVSYKSKQKLMKARRGLKDYNARNQTSHFISEDLTRNRSQLAFEARRLKRTGVIKDTWVFDGKNFIKSHNDNISVCSDSASLPRRPTGAN